MYRKGKIPFQTDRQDVIQHPVCLLEEFSINNPNLNPPVRTDCEKELFLSSE